MTGKRIDFAPVKRSAAGKSDVARKRKVAVKPAVRTATAKPVTRTAVATPVARTVTKPVIKTATTTKVKTTVKLGEIEDVDPRLTMTNVPKRPLNDGTKDKKADTKAKNQKSVYAVPKTPFINQDKVAKRPLSRNVYRSSKPAAVMASTVGKNTDRITTIVDKPEKDSKVGVIVVIILTIILGAVAGTVAFLLLPK